MAPYCSQIISAYRDMQPRSLYRGKPFFLGSQNGLHELDADISDQGNFQKSDNCLTFAFTLQ